VLQFSFYTGTRNHRQYIGNVGRYTKTPSERDFEHVFGPCRNSSEFPKDEQKGPNFGDSYKISTKENTKTPLKTSIPFYLSIGIGYVTGKNGSFGFGS